jgi:hypothetical protein
MTVRDRRALQWGILAVVGAVLLLRVLPWGVRRALSAERELAASWALLTRTRAELADEEPLTDSVARVTQAVVALAPRILSGGTAADAAADLSGRVSLAATRHHAKLERTDALADSVRASRLARVAVRATIETDVRGLSEFLQAVAQDPAVLSADELHVVANDPASGDGPEVLRVEVTVRGWYLGGRGSGKGEGSR